MTFTMRLIVIMALMLFGESPACASQSSEDRYGYYDPLLWAPLIVTGQVVSVTASRSTTEEWGMIVSGGPLPIEIETVQIEIDGVLKGALKGSDLSVSMFSSLHKFRPNPITVRGRIMMAIYFNKKAGRYQLRNYSGLFLDSNGTWTHPDPSIYEYTASELTLTNAKAKERISSMDARNIAEQAEIVLAGTLGSISKAFDSATGASKVSWIMNVDVVLKGHYTSKSIKFSMLSGDHLPEWAVPIPQTATNGEQWIVFLAHQGNELIPFAGLNGMLRVDGGKLLYDDTIECGISRDSLFDTVKAVSGEPSHD